ncbi:DUF3558 domain-containing protein [Kutzneria buriramensis]|uniref:Uncharacterized protein DUF3558 n=1 Tax=Kutzneria buriramensis TaxID=1045776 RepID=A0A3E0I8G3_9PSEU|nr:DUF3558 domain-containing protein [Kutzneria buriramensis]REH55068.1 uncharacterized protein DUF3558 [Kutzneria buriramensis]
MTVRIGLGAVAVLVAVAMAGCSTTTDGGHADPQPSTSGSASPTVSRPKDLKIANVDPCTLLTDAQLTQMGITHKSPGPGHPEGGSTTSCSYTVNQPAVYGLNVSLDIKRGVESWLGGAYEGQDVRQLSVQSYPAAQTLLINEKFSDPYATACSTFVSTADGQELNVAITQTTNGLSTTQMCDLSKQAAGLAFTTLQANQ